MDSPLGILKKRKFAQNPVLKVYVGGPPGFIFWSNWLRFCVKIAKCITIFLYFMKKCPKVPQNSKKWPKNFKNQIYKFTFLALQTSFFDTISWDFVAKFMAQLLYLMKQSPKVAQNGPKLWQNWIRFGVKIEECMNKLCYFMRNVIYYIYFQMK